MVAVAKSDPEKNGPSPDVWNRVDIEKSRVHVRLQTLRNLGEDFFAVPVPVP